MLVFILALIAVVGSMGLTFTHPATAAGFLNIGIGSAVNALAWGVETYNVIRNFIIGLVIFVSIYIGLFVLMIALGWESVALGMLVLSMAPLLALAYINYQLQNPVAGTGKILADWGERLAKKGYALKPPTPKLLPNGETPNQYGYKAICAILNILYVPTVGLALTASAFFLGTAGLAAQTLAKTMRYTARLGAFIWIWLGAIALLMLFDIQTGLGLVDFFTVLVLGGGSLFLYLALSILGDWKLPVVGVPTMSVIPATIMSVLIVATTFAHVDPDLAAGMAQPFVIAHDGAVSYFADYRTKNKQPTYKKYMFTKNVTVTFIKKGKKFVLAETGTDALPIFKKGEYGYLPGGQAAPTTDDTKGKKMVLIGPPVTKALDDLQDLEDVEDKWRWVEYSDIKVVSSETPSETKTAEDAKLVKKYADGLGWTINPPSDAPCGNLATLPSSVQINADGSEMKMVLPANLDRGLASRDSNGKEFVIHQGDEFEVIASGNIKFSNDHPCVGPTGMKGWMDTHVDSPFHENVGGLEFSIGGLEANRFLAGERYSGVAQQTGVFTGRVIEQIKGYGDDNSGNFTITVKIVKRAATSPSI